MKCFLENWRCDQYRWVNQGVRKLPKQDPILKKSYFQAHTSKGATADFTRHAYELLHEQNGVVLVHYLGNEKAAEQFPHGNSKHHDRSFVRTCPSVIKKLEKRCTSNATAQVYKSEVADCTSTQHLPVLTPRNSKQVENVRFKQLQKQRISHDALYNIHELAVDFPEFVHTIHTHPDLVCVLGLRAILDQLDRVLLLKTSAQLISYDTTFQLGDFYVSVLCFRHTLFREAPVIPAAFLLHERKFEAYHKLFFKTCTNVVPSLSRIAYPFVTDEEKGIVNAISEILPNASQFRCWNHTLRDVTRWLRSHGAPCEDVSVYLSDLRLLFHLSTETEYKDSLAGMKEKWSAPFFEYFSNNINPDIHSIARWAIEPHGIYNPYSGITNNQSESLNYVMKQLQNWHEAPLDCMALSLYYLQRYYMLEICRGQHGVGNYHVHPQYRDLEGPPIPNEVIYSPTEIVAKVQGNIEVVSESASTSKQPSQANSHLTQKARAQQVLDDNKISYDSKLHTFTVLGSENRPQAIKLFPKPTCTCPRTKQCYHIIAAKLYLGMEDTAWSKSKLNLTQLRKNTRKRKEKKSGRKIPRAGDYEVLPAPDAASAVSEQDSGDQLIDDSSQLTTQADQPASEVNQPVAAVLGEQASDEPLVDDATFSQNTIQDPIIAANLQGYGDSTRPSAQVDQLLNLLEKQLLDDSLLRFWKTGADSFLHSSKEDNCSDLLSTFFADNDDGAYALSKDVDVGLWSDFRCFNGEPPLKFVNEDFVVINDELHQQFDEFKANEMIPLHSFLPLNELLEYYCRSECEGLMESSLVSKYGRSYLCLSSAEVDGLVEWILKMRSQHTVEGTFVISIVEDIMEKFSVTDVSKPVGVKRKLPLTIPVQSKKQHRSFSQNLLAKRLMFSKRQSSTKIKNKAVVILNTEHQPRTPRTRHSKMWLAEHCLTQRDKEVLLSQTGWLTDSTINVAQRLLAEQFPHLSGFQDVSKGLTLSYNIIPGDFLQIINTGHQHWVTISTMSVEFSGINVYDSQNDFLPTLAKAQIACIMFSQMETVEVKMMGIQKQSGSCDCGLFAVANATALAHGQNPVNCVYDQARMRPHLFSCLVSHKVTPFPHKQVTNIETWKKNDFYIHCRCRLPEMKNLPMIECTKCQKWFHTFCEDVPDDIVDEPAAEWLCNSCA